MKSPQRGEVWLIDLGLAAKVRPCLVLSVPTTDVDRALVTVVPHTTSLRRSRFEVSVPVAFLRPEEIESFGVESRIFLADLLGTRVDLITESGLREAVRPAVERDAIRVA